jgi:alanine-glyoxylate transaminase/serine-glyoxylate transaminase/serine-pyruvate transaminase
MKTGWAFWLFVALLVVLHFALHLTLGIGLGMAEVGDPARDAFFRLGHMGHVNGQMIMGMLGGMQAGMSALGIAHGRGALDAAAEVIGGA